MDKQEHIVEIERGVWLAQWNGDPGRTLVIRNAQRFKGKSAAKGALTRARKYRPFEAARIRAVVVVGTAVYERRVL